METAPKSKKPAAKKAEAEPPVDEILGATPAETPPEPEPAPDERAVIVAARAALKELLEAGVPYRDIVLTTNRQGELVSATKI